MFGVTCWESLLARFRLATIDVCRFLKNSLPRTFTHGWYLANLLLRDPDSSRLFVTHCTVYKLRLLQRQNMRAVKIGMETDNTVADTMAPVTAKKTQIVVSKPVSISEKALLPVNFSNLHYDKFQLECEAILGRNTKWPLINSHSHLSTCIYYYNYDAYKKNKGEKGLLYWTSTWIEFVVPQGRLGESYM